MDTDRPDAPKPSAKVVPIRRRRVVRMGKLGTPDARPIPPGATVKAMEFRDRRTGEVIKRVEFGADGKPRQG